MESAVEEFIPRPVRRAFVDHGSPRKEVFCAVDLVKATLDCGNALARTLTWRILREHFDEDSGVFEVRFPPEEEPTLALDARRAFDLVCLIPNCPRARELRRRAWDRLLAVEDAAAAAPRVPCCKTPRVVHHRKWRLLLAATLIACASRFAVFFFDDGMRTPHPASV